MENFNFQDQVCLTMKMKLDKNVTKNSTLNFADIQEAPATQRIPH
jgi:hypothetical protein